MEGQQKMFKMPTKLMKRNNDNVSSNDSSTTAFSPQQKKKARRTSASSATSLRKVSESIVGKIEYIESTLKTADQLPAQKLLITICAPALTPNKRSRYHYRAANILKNGLHQLRLMRDSEVEECTRSVDTLQEKCSFASANVEKKKVAIESQEKECTSRRKDLDKLKSELQVLEEAESVVLAKAIECRQRCTAARENLEECQGIQESQLKQLCARETHDARDNALTVLPVLRRLFSDPSLLEAAEDALPRNTDERTGFDKLATNEVVRTFDQKISLAEERLKLLIEEEKNGEEALAGAEQETKRLKKLVGNAQERFVEAANLLQTLRVELKEEEAVHNSYQAEYVEAVAKLERIKCRIDEVDMARGFCEELCPPPLPQLAGA